MINLRQRIWMGRVFFLLLLTAAAGIEARENDGTLGLIQTPNNGVPAIVFAGKTFDAVLTARAELKLAAADKEYPVTAEFAPLPGGRYRATCSLPPDAPAGTYSLLATADGKSDRNDRAVFVRAESPEYYVIGHLSDTHVGREGLDAAARGVLDALNQSEAAFVIVTGDLTDHGEPEQYRAFLGILDTCKLPTFVCPGNHDRKADNYEQFFGPLTYMFTFGPDGYLAFDTMDYAIADDLGPQNGLLEIYRRALKPCRWSVGLTHRYDPAMGMRSQLILFIDNPLDFLLFGHWHRENTQEEKTVPWGGTRISVVPAALDGQFRLLDMTARGLLPRPVQKIEAK